MSNKVIFWFRNDLRLFDNPGLFEAAINNRVLPIFIIDEINAQFKLGGVTKWWLYQSLKSLNQSLNNNLNIYVGDSKTTLEDLLARHNIKQIIWNRRYEPDQILQDTNIKQFFRSRGIICKSFSASLLWEPFNVLTNNGTPYKVFTPFYRKGCLGSVYSPRSPIPMIEQINLIKDCDYSIDIESLIKNSYHPWQKNIANNWQVGEKFATSQLNNFLSNGINGYKERRNLPALNNVSKLSPYLHFGEISPHQILAALKEKNDAIPQEDQDCFLSELGWREFSYYLLYHFPNLPKENFQKKFDDFPWREDPTQLQAWQKGQTGYPLIDAGMRQLWQTGYMHNRVRMAVASFLVKNLMLHWHYGRDWFWDCLVDADLANNSASWQWVAGCGADAAPYFRIFNPILQGEKFDPEGEYTKQFVPELKKMPNSFLYKPWLAPKEVLNQAGVKLGYNYPNPIVSLEDSRNKAMAAYKKITEKT